MEDPCPELLPQSSLHLKHEELSPPPYSNMYPSPPVSEYDLSPHHSPVVQTPMMQHHQVLCTEPTQVCTENLTLLFLLNFFCERISMWFLLFYRRQWYHSPSNSSFLTSQLLLTPRSLPMDSPVSPHDLWSTILLLFHQCMRTVHWFRQLPMYNSTVPSLPLFQSRSWPVVIPRCWSTKPETQSTWPCHHNRLSSSHKLDNRCPNHHSWSVHRQSCQRPKNRESPLYVSTLGAPSATWSSPTSKCTSGSIPERSHMCVITRVAENGSQGRTNYVVTVANTLVSDPSSVTCASGNSPALTTSRLTCAHTPERSLTRAHGPTAPSDSPAPMNWGATWPCTAVTSRRTGSRHTERFRHHSHSRAPQTRDIHPYSTGISSTYCIYYLTRYDLISKHGPSLDNCSLKYG